MSSNSLINENKGPIDFLTYQDYKKEIQKNKQQLKLESMKIKLIIQKNFNKNNQYDILSKQDTEKSDIDQSQLITQSTHQITQNTPQQQLSNSLCFNDKNQKKETQNQFFRYQTIDSQDQNSQYQIFAPKQLVVKTNFKQTLGKRSQSQNIFSQNSNFKANKKLTQIQNEKENEIPNITARSWAIFNATTGKQIWLKDAHKKREIASLTKIMTCYQCLIMIEKYCLDMNRIQFKVSQKAASIIGTSAELKFGDKVKICDLLYGLMLPSGNDAAYVLAENFGYIHKIHNKNLNEQIENLRYRNIMSNMKEDNSDIIDCSKKFLNLMNQTAKSLKLKDTNFANMHGLMNKQNYSTAFDLSILSMKCVQHPIFLKICQTPIYSANIQDNQKNFRYKTWKNTNKLISNGFQGIKTGITESAGPCLATYYKSNQFDMVAIVLKCQTLEHRFKESSQLIKWGFKRTTGKNLQL